MRTHALGAGRTRRSDGVVATLSGASAEEMTPLAARFRDHLHSRVECLLSRAEEMLPREG
jgi:hypothetical protein